MSRTVTLKGPFLHGTAGVMQPPKVGDRGCDCLNVCGDDSRIGQVDGVEMCSWGEREAQRLSLAQAMPLRAASLAAALRADLLTQDREPGRRLPTVYLSPATLAALVALEQCFAKEGPTPCPPLTPP